MTGLFVARLNLHYIKKYNILLELAWWPVIVTAEREFMGLGTLFNRFVISSLTSYSHRVHCWMKPSCASTRRRRRKLTKSAPGDVDDAPAPPRAPRGSCSGHQRLRQELPQPFPYIGAHIHPTSVPIKVVNAIRNSKKKLNNYLNVPSLVQVNGVCLVA